MKVKFIMVMALVIGIFTVGSWAMAFLWFILGGSIGESVKLIACIEFIVAVVMTSVVVAALIDYVRISKGG